MLIFCGLVYVFNLNMKCECICLFINNLVKKYFVVGNFEVVFKLNLDFGISFKIMIEVGVSLEIKVLIVLILLKDFFFKV